jgi:hypothetical protein
MAAEKVIACAERGCHGGRPEATHRILFEQGLPPEDDWPYRQPISFDTEAAHAQAGVLPITSFFPPKQPTQKIPKDGCKDREINGHRGWWARDVDPARRLYDEPAQPPATATLAGEDMFMGAILHYGGVVVRIPVTEDFLSYKSGVFKRAGMLSDADTVAWHAVQLIGWGGEGPNRYWIGENSWGEAWGLGGYFYFLRGQNHLGIEDLGIHTYIAVEERVAANKAHLHTAQLRAYDAMVHESRGLRAAALWAGIGAASGWLAVGALLLARRSRPYLSTPRDIYE